MQRQPEACQAQLPRASRAAKITGPSAAVKPEVRTGRAPYMQADQLELVPRLLAQDEAKARGDQPSETRLIVVLHNGVDHYEATTMRDED